MKRRIRAETASVRGTVVAMAASVLACAPTARSFTAADETAVRALEQAYRGGWLANDSAAVMATLAPDAVLMPGGVEPLSGEAAIRAFWWPADGSLTTIESYDITIDDIHGSGDLAYVRGRGSIGFTYRDPTGVSTRLNSDAVHLTVARRGVDGRWSIAQRAWSAIP